jgi:hypothetical protein
MTMNRKLYQPLLLAVVLAIYSVTLKHGFVWDDHTFTEANRVYRDFDLGKIFFSLGNGVEYLPLRDLSYALDFLIWGNNPLGFHLTNVALFALNVLLVFLFTSELPFGGDDWETRRNTAFLTALIFAVHPINSEAVNFITCRNVLVSGAAFFGAAAVFARYLNGEGKPSPFAVYLLLPLCFLAALLSKATGIVLPLVLLLMACTVPSARSLRQTSAVLAPLFVMAGLFFWLYRAVAMQSGVIGGQAEPLAARVAVALQIPFFYLKKLLVPVGFSAEYAADGFSENLVSSGATLALAGIVLLGLAALRMRRRPVVAFSLFWYAVTLLPVSNLFATYPIVADRYAYLPSFGFALLLASLAARFLTSHPRPAAAAAALLVLLLGGASFARSLDWRSDLTLWEANLKSEPSNAKAYQNLAAEAIIAGELPRARQILAQGRLAAPSPMYDYLEGRIQYQRHDLAAALSHFEKVLQQDDQHIRTLLAMGAIYQELGDLDRAEGYYRRTLKADAADSWGCRDEARARLLAMGRPAGQ